MVSSSRVPRRVHLALAGLALVSATEAQDGRGPHDRFGESLAFCGDVDGDGRSDLAIGSSREAGVGAIRVYSIATGELVRKHSGSPGRVGFGSELAVCPDLDGDRVPEVATCSWKHGYSRPEGRIEVRSGRSGEVLRSFEAQEGEFGFGRFLDAIGDLDADGTIEFGFVVADPRPEADRTAHWVVLSGERGARVWSCERPRRGIDHHAGSKFAPLDDLDGDRGPEVAVLVGRSVLVVSCAKSAILAEWPDPARTTPRTAFGSIASPGDLDGDGSRELIVGEPDPGFAAGRVHLLNLGRASESIAVRLGDGRDKTSRYGSAVSVAGDVDADGTPDWLASEQHSFGGIVSVVSGRTVQEIRWADSADFELPPIGWEVVGGADVDADGVPDFAASRYWPKMGFGVPGQGVLVFSGRTGRRIRAFVLEGSLPPHERPAASSK